MRTTKNRKPRNNKFEAHGYWISYWHDNLEFRGAFINGLPVGYHEWFHLNGKITKEYHII